MQRFEAIRFGNDSDNVFSGGHDGADTCFLVRAGSVEQAAGLADRELARMPDGQVAPWCGMACLPGTGLSTDGDARVLRSPCIQHAYRHGWRHWYLGAREGPWTERTGA